MSNRLLKQEEIDALLNAQVLEPAQQEVAEAGTLGEQVQPEAAGLELPAEQNADLNGAGQSEKQPGAELPSLSEEEKDALGEVGNICMGSASTTLSMLLNQKVNITSPSVTVTTFAELYSGFDIPHMTIYVRFVEGLSGYNLLIMRLQDAAVLADLMMGGDGANISEELTEIGVSAASEAMNQMIGSASTSMATMFTRTVNISPPETHVYHSNEQARPPELDHNSPIVVVWFKMAIGDVLDTQIMQVMGMDTAREEANLILGQLMGVEAASPVQEEEPAGEAEVKEDSSELDNDFISSLIEELPAPEPAQITGASSGPSASSAMKQQSRAAAAGVRPAVAPPGIDQERLDLILDIPLKVTVLLGRTRWPIKDILGLNPGSVVELQSLVDEPVEVLVNGTLVATGEVVVVNENFGVRITGIIRPEERLQYLGR